MATAGLGQKDGPPLEARTLVCVVGLLGSIVWWYAQANKLVLLKTLEDRIEQEFREFRETISLSNQRRIFKIWTANAVLAFTFPPLFVGAWLYLLHCIYCHR